MGKSKGIKWVVLGLVILTMLTGSGCETNTPPDITSVTPSAGSVARGGSCTISCLASDFDEDALTYDWTATGGTISGTGDTVTWIAPAAEGTYTITVTVHDGMGGITSDSCTVEVVNAPPVITSITPSAESVMPEESCTVGCVASDPDGDPLTYEWTATGGVISGEGNSVTWTAPAAEGTYTITVTVSDGKGGTVGASCEIIVEVLYGSIDVQSDPAGATVYLDGVDTGNITPYVITNLSPGTYTVMLEYYHYEYREAAVTVAANETTYINWPLDYASEQTLTIQPDEDDAKDTSVDTYYPDSNWEFRYWVTAGQNSIDTCRIYIEFDLDSLPENAVITDARLGLCYWDTSNSASTPVGIYNIEESWVVDEVTWNNQPDFDSEVIYTVTVPAGVTDGFLYWNITNLVKAWWDGSIPNYGVMLKDADESSIEAWKRFYSSEWGTAHERPKLTIYYYDPTP